MIEAIEIKFQRGALPLPQGQTDYYHKVMTSTGRDFKVNNNFGVFEVTEEEVPGKSERHLMWHSGVVNSDPELAEFAVRRGKVMFRKGPGLLFRTLKPEGFRLVRNVEEVYAKNIDQWGRRIVVVFSGSEVRGGLPYSFEPLADKDWNTYPRTAVSQRWELKTMTAVNFYMPPYYFTVNPELAVDKVLYSNGVAIPKGSVHVRHRIGGKD